MPEHFHVMITPTVTLERAVQFIKGGFSFRVKKELGQQWRFGSPGFLIIEFETFRTMRFMSNIFVETLSEGGCRTGA